MSVLKGKREKSMFEEYAQLMIQKNEIESKIDELKPQVLESLKNEEDEKVTNTYGRLSIMRRKSWTYPEFVKQQEELYKTAKAKSESEGTATFTTSETVMFKQIEL